MSKKMLVFTTLATALVLLHGWDEPISQAVYSWRQPWLTPIMKAISFVGSKYFLVPVCIAILIWLYRHNRWMAFAIPLGTLFAWGSSEVLKLIIARPRPAISALVQESSYSFPSGHALSNTAFYLLLLMWAPKNRFNQIFCITMIVVMSFSRVYLGVHWTSDVLAGISLGILVVEAVYWLTKRRLKQPSLPSIDR